MLSSWEQLRRLFVVLALCAGAGVRADGAPCPPPGNVNLDLVVPVVRSRTFVEHLRLAQPGEVPVRELNSELLVVYVEDAPSALRYFRVPSGDRDCWAGSDTLRFALRHLASSIKKLGSSPAIKPGVTLITAGGNFEPSLILAMGVLKKVADQPLDAYLVGVPNHDMLLIADPKDSVAAKGLQALVEQSFSKGDKPLSSKIFLVSKCSIEVANPDGLSADMSCR